MLAKIVQLGLALSLVAQVGWCTVVYQNQTTDTFLTAVYSAGPYDGIGDLVTLGGTDRGLQTVTAQFFNLGSAGTFSTTATIWDAAGTTLLGTATVNGLAIDNFGTLDVTFNFAGLAVPDTLSILLGVSSVDAGLDLGLNLFQPPSTGSSSDLFYLTQSAGTISQALTNAGEGNLYLQLDATQLTGTPEPSSWLLAGLGLSGLAWRRRNS